MDSPVMIDLVGDDENQLPSQLKNKAIITGDFDSKIAHIQKYLSGYQCTDKCDGAIKPSAQWYPAWNARKVGTPQAPSRRSQAPAAKRAA